MLMHTGILSTPDSVAAQTPSSDLTERQSRRAPLSTTNSKSSLILTDTPNVDDTPKSTRVSTSTKSSIQLGGAKPDPHHPAKSGKNNTAVGPFKQEIVSMMMMMLMGMRAHNSEKKQHDAISDGTIF